MAKQSGILVEAALLTGGLLCLTVGHLRDSRIFTVAGCILLLVWFAFKWISRANGSQSGQRVRKRSTFTRTPVSVRPPARGRPDWGAIPKDLDLQKDTPLKPLAEKLTASLDPAYVEKVKNRFLKDHPEWTPSEFDWALFELKRFFLLSAILRYTPMYSRTVDEVWHTMLLFTREYEDFCYRFAGRMIHHVPNPEPALNPAERAWFDWTYHQIFHPVPYSWFAWKGFFRYPLPADLIREFEEGDLSALQEKYFRPDTPYAQWLVNAFRDQISQAKMELSGSTKGDRTTRKSRIPILAAGAASMVYFSLAAPEQFAARMASASPATAAAAKRDRSGGSSGGCGAYYWGDVDSDHRHSPGHDGSCGSSACGSSGHGGSSCGSSCGSGCGGGCGGS